MLALLRGVLALGLQLVEIQTVSAIDNVHDWQDQAPGRPVEQAIRESKYPHDRRSNQVIGKGPEVAATPYLPNRLSLRQRNHNRDRKGVGDKKDGSGKCQPERRLKVRRQHQWQMVGMVGRRGCDGDIGHAEQNLNGTRPNPRMPETLYQDANDAND